MAISGRQISPTFALVAGDSNVRRMSYLFHDDDLHMKCLPVSGAKFVRDRKNFRHMLKTEITRNHFDVVYLHLGSNDVLCDEDTFYRSIAEICDVLHEASPSTHIVLCQILPRNCDERRGQVPATQLGLIQRWIRMANQLLQEFAKFIPYVRFFSYGRNSVLLNFLSKDGLHLNPDGAKKCFNAINDDLWSYDINTDSNQTVICDDWPDLSVTSGVLDEEVQHQYPQVHSYASVLKRTPPPDINSNPRPTKREIRHLERKVPSKVKYDKQSGKKYSSRRSNKCFDKVFTRNIRVIADTVKMVQVDVTNDVSVVMKASVVQAKLFKNTTVQHTSYPKESPRVDKKRRICNKTFKHLHRKKLHCPECKITCSRDDFLIDHVYCRHVRRAVASVPKASLSTDMETKKEISHPVTDNQCKGTDEKMSYSFCEGLYFIFPPSIWRRLFQLMLIGRLCGRQGLHHVIKVFAQQNVNTARLRLLLSNDVETNPGPVFNCMWEACSYVHNGYADLLDHLKKHAESSTQCHWATCSGMEQHEFILLRTHILQHVYDNEDISTIDDWITALPGGFDEQKTNLNLCPKRLRSKMLFHMFDEDFIIKYPTYTAQDHQSYLNRLSILEPSTFKQMEINFIHKRAQYGETWSAFDENNIENYTPNNNNASQFTPKKSIYIVPHERKYEFVSTTRPELASDYFSGTKLKSLKRKHDITDTNINSLNETYSWSRNLFANLSLCDSAIRIQNNIMCSMLENSIVSPKKQSFFKIEQALARLSSIENCCSGSFIYTAFRCSIGDRQVFYIRYVESGVYAGLMQQRYLNLLKVQAETTDDNILLHNVITDEDIQTMRRETSADKGKRARPDKVLKFSFESTLPTHLQEMDEIRSCPEIQLHSFVVHLLPYSSKSSVHNPGKILLRVNSTMTSADIDKMLVDFRLNKLQHVQVSAKDILKPPACEYENLLKQSILLNCLSGDISQKCKAHLFKKKARFESNFISNGNLSLATSLRNRIMSLYLRNYFDDVVSFFQKYFPELAFSTEDMDNLTSTNNDQVPVPKTRKVEATAKPIKVVTVQNLNDRLGSICPIQETSANLFENYIFNLLQHGQFYIQCFDESSGGMVCILNDYSETDGSFKCSDFVRTVRYRQEGGDYFHCSCRSFTTLLQDIENAIEEDTSIVSSVTCIHCRFVQEKVLTSMNAGNKKSTLSQLEVHVQDAMQSSGQKIIQLKCKTETRKYSILGAGDDVPSFVHLTLNKRLNKFIVSCFNGQCKSRRGHKKNLGTFQSSSLCKHLSELKNETSYWLHLTEFGTNTQFVQDDDNSNNIVSDWKIFDEDSGLWNFKALSKHSPNKSNSLQLKSNILKRDTWNDQNLTRLVDGCLKGPVLFPDVPGNTCECGGGWLKREDDEDYNENGLTIQEKKRTITIYTNFAPVKCDVHSRICYGTETPCKLVWGEGLSESIHVLSRDTAAGDEIGWEFIDLVLNCDCTFSSFCTIKSNLYKRRDPNASFMDKSVFIKWWFSWAASMKIDFRKPCNVCKFEPKRLCCDGTKVGVGFRNADFEEINKSNPNIPVNETLHRRMDRCFLKNMNNIDKKHMVENRLTLDYLARMELGELKNEEILSAAQKLEKINQVKQVLPEEVLPSFERFFEMSENEKFAYASVLKMLATTACITSFLPSKFCPSLQQFVSDPDNIDGESFNKIIREMRSYCPELRDLIAESMLNNNEVLPGDIRLLLQFLINESLNIAFLNPETAVFQPGTYNPAKFGRAYYFNPHGLKLRDIRKFSIDNDRDARRNIDHDDAALEFEKCQKLYSKVQTSAPGTTNLFLWFCADHGHCYGFHMTGAEGRKDPFASLYSYLEKPPESVFYDFACNLQEYCLNRESGYYRNVRFFHDIFHGFAHKCSAAFRSSRLQGLESVNTEICEQFNSFIQHIKKSARQMSQAHFCFYLQFFLHQWNERKRSLQDKKMQVVLSGLD